MAVGALTDSGGRQRASGQRQGGPPSALVPCVVAPEGSPGPPKCSLNAEWVNTYGRDGGCRQQVQQVQQLQLHRVRRVRRGQGTPRSR